MQRLRCMTIALLLAATARCGYPNFEFTTMCDLVDATSCGAGARCTIVEPTTGKTGCVAADPSPKSPYAACSSDKECPAGTWCDGRTGTCMLFCQSMSDCGGNDCVATYYTVNGKPVTVPGGANVCVANCDPVSAVPCGSETTCGYDPQIGVMDCFATNGFTLGQACMYINDCGPGLVCVSTCQKWCRPPGQSSSDCGGGTCGMFTNLAPMYDGQLYGACQ
jgi:hypothetical protein